jgi:hypothetical protein
VGTFARRGKHHGHEKAAGRVMISRMETATAGGKGASLPSASRGRVANSRLNSATASFLLTSPLTEATYSTGSVVAPKVGEQGIAVEPRQNLGPAKHGNAVRMVGKRRVISSRTRTRARVA